MFELAKNIEKEGVEYYQELARNTKSKQLAGVFNLLAEEENKHYNLFDAYQSSQTGPDTFEKRDIIASAKSIFKSLSKESYSPKKDYDAAYQKALMLEKNSITFYKNALKDTNDQAVKNIINVIIEEEGKHYKIISSIIDYVKRPVEWVENAEFNHMEEY